MVLRRLASSGMSNTYCCVLILLCLFSFHVYRLSSQSGTDMVVESPRFRLVTDLLEKGYKVYVQEIDDVKQRYEDELCDKYGDDNLIFVSNPSEVYETVWRIDL